MNIIYFVYELIKYINEGDEKFANFCSLFVNHFFEFHLMLKIPYYLKLHRIYKILIHEAFNKNYPELSDISKRVYSELNYLKLYFILIISAFMVRILIILIFPDSSYIMNPFHFVECFNVDQIAQVNDNYNSIFWILVDFLDQAILFFFAFILFTCKNNKQHLIKLELILFMVVWVCYPNNMRIFQFTKFDKDPTIISLLCIMYINLTVIVISYVPIIYVYLQRKREIYKDIIESNTNTFAQSNNKNTLNHLNFYLQDTKNSDVFLLDFKYFEDMILFSKKINNNQITNLLYFYKELQEIEKEFYKLKVHDLIEKFEIIFNKYCTKRSTFYIDFPTEIYQDCVNKLLKIKSQDKKIKIFDSAIKFANARFKEKKLPHFGSVKNTMEDADKYSSDNNNDFLSKNY